METTNAVILNAANPGQRAVLFTGTGEQCEGFIAAVNDSPTGEGEQKVSGLLVAPTVLDVVRLTDPVAVGGLVEQQPFYVPFTPSA